MHTKPPPRAWSPMVDAGTREPRLLDRVRLAVRARHYSLRTEEAYVAWVKRYVLFHGKRHPQTMGEPEIVAHVSLEDPRAHLLLGQIAVALQDRATLREAKAFLQFFQLNFWERRLDEAVQSGSPTFEFIA